MSKRLQLLLLGLFFIFSFTIFSLLVKRGGMKDLDFTVTVKVQERIDNSSRLRLARLTGEVMEGATFLASPMVSIIAIIIITIITLIRRKRFRVVALLIPIAFGLLTIAEIYGKSVVHHPAPPFFLLKNPTTIFPKYQVLDNFSYPSGHAARAMFLGITLYSFFMLHTSLFKRKKIKVLTMIGIISYVGLISVSRIYLGQHWISDVVGGLTLGSGSGLLTFAGLLSYNRTRNE